MTNRAEVLARLKEWGQHADEQLPLGKIALWLSQLEMPQADTASYEAHLEQIRHDLRDWLGADPKPALTHVAEGLRQIIAQKYHYNGDNDSYDDLQNANLMRVIDRRRGLPITLGIIYLEIVRGLGFEADGLNFPGHFLLRLTGGRERVIIDPFHSGQEMNAVRLRQMLKAAAGMAAELTPDHYLPMSNRQMLLRLQNNIKLRQVQAGRLREALGTVAVMQALAPAEVTLWRELGLLHAALGELGEAIKYIQIFYERAQDARSKQQAQMLLQELKSRLN